jgi:predicted DNA-binding transcriptional regulator AlpA
MQSDCAPSTRLRPEPESVIPIRHAPDRDAVRGVATPPAALAPLLVPARVAGPLCGRSEASWWRDHAAALIPAPVKIGHSTRWRVEELHRWIDAGCPDRKKWDALERVRKGR